MVFVDTSALIAILDEDDLRHQEALATFRWLAVEADLVTHNYIHVEAIAVAERRLGLAAGRRLTDIFFPIIRTIWIDEVTHVSALLSRNPSPRVSLVDQISFAVMRANAIGTAFAYDSHFEREGFELASVQRRAEDEHVLHEKRAPYGESPWSDAVGVAEISARAGRSVNTVQSWRRRHDDFPKPLAELAAGPIWSWPTIADWIAGRRSFARGV